MRSSPSDRLRDLLLIAAAAMTAIGAVLYIIPEWAAPRFLSAPAATFDALEAARDLRGDIPVFVAAAREDEPFATDARAIAVELGVPPTIVDGDGHGSGMLRDHPRLTEEILAFADASLADEA